MGPTAFTRLYAEHARSVYAYLCYRTGDRLLAEDLLGDTFERVLRARGGYDRRRGSERTWLYAIALNCVRDNARRVAAETRALANYDADRVVPMAIDSVADAVERREIIRVALLTLCDEEREVLALRFGGDLQLAEIAAIVDEPRSKVETRIYRGLKKMRALLADESRPGAATIP